MSIWGKIIGGAAGLAVGGPVGGLVGLLLGAAVDEGVERAGPSPAARRQVTFTIGVIALAAKMAKADGYVSRAEIRAFQQVFRVPPGEEKNVARIFNLAREHTAGYEAYARQLAGVMHDNRAVLADLLDALFFIAQADGEIHPNELAYIISVAQIFGFSAAEIEEITARYIGPDRESPYTILGVAPTVSDSELKQRYRALIRETHPDRMMAEGVPPELVAVATRRMAEINTAYDQIVAARAGSTAGD